MKIELESTETTAVLHGHKARIWQGHTEQGTPVIAFVTLVAAEDADDRDLAVELHGLPTSRG